MVISVAAFVSALLGAWFLTPMVRDAAHGAGLLDVPEERKVHNRALPRLGGVAIAAAFYLGVAAGLVAARFIGHRLELASGHLPAILVGVALIAGVGLLDDLQGMRARVKLGAQVLVALVAYGLGLSIDRMHGPWGVVELGPWSLLLTVAWFVAVVNAINLIDGLDGLAPGTALIAMVAFFGMTIGVGRSDAAVVAIAAGAGGVIGFLRYNVPPASIIMGDSGAMLLGFLLAAVAVSLTQLTTQVTPWAPMLVLALPLVDMAWAIIRRLARGVPIFAPDKRHIHHQLVGLGLSTRAAVFVLWAVSAVAGAFAVLLARP
ncbi:MAG TPA: MraY family glycosyltransferase [Candidatus Limnocylindria bacterium]|nr:MraY family glycosyltransferase [Candidatus Limnocylindria bacterium]